MINFLSGLSSAPTLIAIGALAGFAAGSSSTYMVIDAIYDLDGSSRIIRSVDHAEETVKKRHSMQDKDHRELQALRKKFNDLRKTHSEGDDALCIAADDGWLLGKQGQAVRPKAKSGPVPSARTFGHSGL